MAGVVHGTQDAIATNFSGRIAIPSWPDFSVGFFVWFVVCLCVVLVFVCLFFLCLWFRLLVCVLLMRPGHAHWTMYRSAIALFCGPSTLTDMHGNLPISFRQVQTC